jgi:hypothetical protein
MVGEYIGEIKPTKIVYKPHCGKCMFPIDTSEYEITYQDIYDRPAEMMLARKVGANIYPDRCAHCGALFDSIEIPMPKQLPDIFLEE